MCLDVDSPQAHTARTLAVFLWLAMFGYSKNNKPSIDPRILSAWCTLVDLELSDTSRLRRTSPTSQYIPNS
jgi:hypothetical protein